MRVALLGRLDDCPDPGLEVTSGSQLALDGEGRGRQAAAAQRLPCGDVDQRRQLLDLGPAVATDTLDLDRLDEGPRAGLERQHSLTDRLVAAHDSCFRVAEIRHRLQQSPVGGLHSDRELDSLHGVEEQRVEDRGVGRRHADEDGRLGRDTDSTLGLDTNSSIAVRIPGRQRLDGDRH